MARRAHSALAARVRQMLAPQVRPRCVVRLAVYLIEDTTPETELGILRPDFEVLHSRTVMERSSPYAAGVSPFTPSIFALALVPISVRMPEIEIRDANANRLVTTIEILSPVNKRELGLSLYRRKRRRLQRVGVHLIEIDLIRCGHRPYSYPTLSPSLYLVTLLRS